MCFDYIIVGAGITGLSAGINALLKGYKVVIYEKNECISRNLIVFFKNIKKSEENPLKRPIS